MFENIKDWFFGTDKKENYERTKEDLQSKGANIVKIDEENVPILGKIVAFVGAIFKKDDEKN